VAAWRHGLAHYRDSALERVRTLDRELLALAFGVPLERWDDAMLTRLLKDRWYRPDQEAAPTKARVVGRVGAFVGFGGRFAEPPLALIDQQGLLLQSGSACFSVHADAFGATLQAIADSKNAARPALPEGWYVDGTSLFGQAQEFAFAEFGAITSAVASVDTLLLTHAWSHGATLLALPRS
jgi:hypothetical protein